MRIVVRAPVPGTVVTLDEVPDVVFAGRLLGAGLAIEPDRDDDQVVLSPAGGVLASVYPHAVAIALELSRTGPERALLVHLGIDTVELRGAGFTSHIGVGSRVEAGTELVTWSPHDVAQGGRSAVCPVVAMGAAESDLEMQLEPGQRVEAGQPLFIWS